MLGSNTARIIDQIKPKPDFVLRPSVEPSRILQRPPGGLNLTLNPKKPER